MPEKTKEELEQEQQQLTGQVEEAANKEKQEAEKEGVSDEEVNRRVEAARKEEKDKLYPKLEEVTTALKDVQNQLREEREEKEREQRATQAETERKRQEGLSETQRTLEMIQKLEEKLRQEQSAREDSERRADQYRKDEELRRYREAAIAAAGDRIISDLVVGNTPEEIDRAVDKAKARYEEVEERTKQMFEQERQQRSGGGRRVPGSASPDFEAFDEETLDSDLTSVDTDKYMKDPEYRDMIQDKIASEYAKASGR